MYMDVVVVVIVWQFEPCSSRGVLYTTLCDKVRQLLVTCLWCSPGTLVSSTNKADRHYITEICLKLAFNAINLSQPYVYDFESFKM